MQLGYLVFEVRDLRQWADFAREMLGCADGEPGGEARGLRIDGAAYRLLLREGKEDDIAVLGLALRDLEELEGLNQRLSKQGVGVTAMSSAECAARGIEVGVRFVDPMGLVNEAAIGQPRSDAAFSSKAMPGGFMAEDLGLGHAVLSCGRRQADMERFYIDAVGLSLTERIDTKIGPIKVDGAFLHCNRRHHSLALIAIPGRKRLLHFMLQARDLRDVGMALERVKAAGLPLSLDLGQHPDPDGTVSFYAATPSGFCGATIKVRELRQSG